jgi:predicted AAA+ superfamily ATPase
LRKSGANLLPGRSVLHQLHALTSLEYGAGSLDGMERPFLEEGGSALPPLRFDSAPREFPHRGLEDRLLFGDLPGIALIDSAEERRDVLKTYVAAHIEEEIGRERETRNLGVFMKFLRFAAQESGKILNFLSVSKESGLSVPTIKSHYQLLEDMFLGFAVPAFSGSARKSVLTSPRFFFFDLGARNAAAGLEFSPDAVRADPGHLFEHWVGLEIYKRLGYRGQGRLSYLRTSAGMEVDYIIEDEGLFYPIEAKWTDRPALSDAKHLSAFMKDHPDKARHGYIVCRCPYPLALSDRITALPWWTL